MQLFLEEICAKRFRPDWAENLLPVMLNVINIWLLPAPQNSYLRISQWFLYSAQVFMVWLRAYCTLRNGTLRNETKRNEICTLRNGNLYFAKRKSVLCEMKSVLCEMKSVLCEMEICTLRNGNLYFAKRKSVLCEIWKSVLSWKPQTRKTKTLWVSRKLSPKKENIFPQRVWSKHLVYILSTGNRSRLALGALRDGFAK